MTVDEKALEDAVRSYCDVLCQKYDDAGVVLVERRNKAVRAAILAYEAAKAPPGEAVAAGWKLVPVEPTPKMLQDAAFNLSDEFGADFVKPLGEFARALWAEMLAASPAPLPDATVGGVADAWWTPSRIGHVLEDCATYLRTLYARHDIRPGKQAIDLDRLQAAARSAAALVPAATPVSEAGGEAIKVVPRNPTNKQVEEIAYNINRKRRGPHDLTPDDIREVVDNLFFVCAEALAKPASSPAGGVDAVREAFQAGLGAAAEYVTRIASYGHETAAYEIRSIPMPTALSTAPAPEGKG